jgi:hypothetical protein
MKDLAALALVVLPLGMTIVEILAAGDASSAPEQRDTDMGVQPASNRQATATPTEREARTMANRSIRSHASRAPEGHAVPGKPA